MQNLTPVSFIIPTVDNDGRPFPAFAFAQLQEDIADSFGGWSRAEGVGGWLTPDGVVQTEKHFRYEVALAPGQLLDFDEFLRSKARTFGQACIYRVVHDRALVSLLANPEAA